MRFYFFILLYLRLSTSQSTFLSVQRMPFDISIFYHLGTQFFVTPSTERSAGIHWALFTYTSFLHTFPYSHLMFTLGDYIWCSHLIFTLHIHTSYPAWTLSTLYGVNMTIFSEYHTSCSSKSLAPFGKPFRREVHGLLRRYFVALLIRPLSRYRQSLRSSNWKLQIRNLKFKTKACSYNVNPNGRFGSKCNGDNEDNEENEDNGDNEDNKDNRKYYSTSVCRGITETYVTESNRLQ